MATIRRLQAVLRRRSGAASGAIMSAAMSTMTSTMAASCSPDGTARARAHGAARTRCDVPQTCARSLPRASGRRRPVRGAWDPWRLLRPQGRASGGEAAFVLSALSELVDRHSEVHSRHPSGIRINPGLVLDSPLLERERVRPWRIPKVIELPCTRQGGPWRDRLRCSDSRYLRPRGAISALR